MTIATIELNGQVFSEEDAKSDISYNYYDALLGTPFIRSHRIDLSHLCLPALDLADQAQRFSEAEIFVIVRELPTDRVSGPVIGLFFKKAWEIIKVDVVNMFDALWEQDWRSFHHINGAIMTLIPKTSAPNGLKDYRPISLIHSVSKLFSKCFANCLAPRNSELTKANQTAFIKGRRIHDNFRSI